MAVTVCICTASDRPARPLYSTPASAGYQFSPRCRQRACGPGPGPRRSSTQPRLGRRALGLVCQGLSDIGRARCLCLPAPREPGAHAPRTYAATQLVGGCGLSGACLRAVPRDTLTFLASRGIGIQGRHGNGAKLRTSYGPRRPNSARLNGQPWTPAISRSRSTTVEARSGGQGVASSNPASPTNTLHAI
jgi:hypothetical protein